MPITKALTEDIKLFASTAIQLGADVTEEITAESHKITVVFPKSVPIMHKRVKLNGLNMFEVSAGLIDSFKKMGYKIQQGSVAPPAHASRLLRTYMVKGSCKVVIWAAGTNRDDGKHLVCVTFLF